MAEGPNESRPESIGENPFGPPAQPPLSIAHLMLWTAGSALILAIDPQALDEVEFATPGDLRTIITVHRLFSSTIYGVAIASVAIFVHRRFRKGPPFPVQPGHWLLFIQGLLVLFTLPAWSVFVLLQSRWISDGDIRWFTPSILFVGLQVLSHGITIGGYGWALRRLQAERRWRLLFWFELGLGVCNLLACLTEWVRWWPASSFLAFEWMSAFVSAVWLVVVAILDWRQRTRRDWLHWTGVVVQLSGAALAVLTNLCLRLVQ